MRTKQPRSVRILARLARAFETPATSVVPPLRDYPVAHGHRAAT